MTLTRINSPVLKAKVRNTVQDFPKTSLAGNQSQTKQRNNAFQDDGTMKQEKICHEACSSESNVATLLLSCSLAPSEKVNRSFKQETNSWEIKAICLNIMHY